MLFLLNKTLQIEQLSAETNQSSFIGQHPEIQVLIVDDIATKKKRNFYNEEPVNHQN